MSKARRRAPLAAIMDQENPKVEDSVTTSSRDNVTTLHISPEAVSEPPKKAAKVRVRDSYHTSVYLPEEAAFALREIALVKRYRKPHTVMLEAMADLFERYNKADLAAQLRVRIANDDRGS